MNRLPRVLAYAVGAVVLGHGFAAAPALGQEPSVSQDISSETRRVSLLAGLGNAMGGFGGTAELYFAHTRGSVFGGIGYMPEYEEYPSGAAAAFGVRGYTGGRNHRGFLELALTPLLLEAEGTPGSPDGAIRYGPSVQLGYQLVTKSGFTFAVFGGVGRALNVSADSAAVQATGGLGLGYTWRR